MTIRFERWPQLHERRGVCHSTHYADIAAGLWTRGVRIAGRSVGWPAHETDALLAARMAGDDDAAIRALVAQLHAARVTR